LKPYDHQITYSEKGLEILQAYNLVYFAMEERTGKTLTSILTVEAFKSKNILIITQKKALEGWKETLDAYSPSFDYTLVNYHKAKDIGEKEFDLVILDEAHTNISSFPERKSIWSEVFMYTQGKPIVYLSATPHSQGYHLLFNQFSLSDYGPWSRYGTGLDWFSDYGYPHSFKKEVKRGRGSFHVEVPVYTNLKEKIIKAETDKYFLTATRKELGFEHDPEDKVHIIQLAKETKDFYNHVMSYGVYTDKDGNHRELEDDTALRAFAHALEGGTLKVDDKTYVDLPNQEKIDYILEKWGDIEGLVIMYHFKGELIKLQKHFKNATLLQGVSYAEGVDLSEYEHLVIYSQNYSVSKHSQRRARQANMKRKDPITVHFLLTPGGISEQVYNSVAISMKNYVISRFERKLLT